MKYKMSKDCDLHPETVVELLNLGQLGNEAEHGQKQTSWKHLDREQFVYMSHSQMLGKFEYGLPA